MTSSLRLLALTLAVPALGASANGQFPAGFPVPPPGYEIRNALDLEDLGLPSVTDVQRLEWGNFSGDFSGELAYLAGGLLYVSRIPYVFSSIKAVPTSVSPIYDMTSITSDSDAAVDRLIVAHAANLVVHDWDSVSMSFAAGTVLNSTDYAGCTRIKTTDYDQDGYTDILALDADGKTVRVAELVGTTLTEIDSVTLPVAPVDFTLLPWGASGTKCVAAVFPGLGLYVYDFNGVQKKRFGNASLAGGVEAFKSFDSGTGITSHRVFWWYLNTSTGHYEARAANSGGLELPFEIDFPPINGQPPVQMMPRGIAVGDHDLDQNEDILLATDHFTTILLLNQHSTAFPPPPHFGSGAEQYVSIPTSSQPANTHSEGFQPALADMDFDGAKNPVIVDDVNDIIFFIHNITPSSQSNGNLVLSTYTTDDIVSTQTCFDYVEENTSNNTPESSNFNLALHNPEEAVTVKNYNYLQVQIYHQNGTSGTFGYLDPGARFNQAYVFSNTQASLNQWRKIGLTYSVNGVSTVPEGTWWPAGERRNFWVLFRFIEYDVPSSHLVAASQFFMAAMTLKDDEYATFGSGYEDYLDALPGSGVPKDMVEATDPTEVQNPPGNTHAGVYVSQSVPPSFPPSNPPVPGPLVVTSEVLGTFPINQ